MKYKLNIVERIGILSIIPKEGNFATLKISRDLQATMGFSEEEYKKWGIKSEGTMTSWKQNVDTSVDKDIGEKASDIIIDALKKLDEQKKLKPELFSLYEKFVEK